MMPGLSKALAKNTGALHRMLAWTLTIHTLIGFEISPVSPFLMKCQRCLTS